MDIWADLARNLLLFEFFVTLPTKRECSREYIACSYLYVDIDGRNITKVGTVVDCIGSAARGYNILPSKHFSSQTKRVPIVSTFSSWSKYRVGQRKCNFLFEPLYFPLLLSDQAEIW
jgi:hypothetical protein